MQVSGEEESVFLFDNASGAETGSLWPNRPVDVAIGRQGEMLLSDNGADVIVALRFVNEPLYRDVNTSLPDTRPIPHTTPIVSAASTPQGPGLVALACLLAMLAALLA